MENERINDFGISSVEIYTMLKNKKVKYLYHANTLTTEHNRRIIFSVAFGINLHFY
jgi:hypothetical protein